MPAHNMTPCSAASSMPSFLDMTERIVDDEYHLVQAKRPALVDLTGSSWIDCGASIRMPPGDGQPSPDDLLFRLLHE